MGSAFYRDIHGSVSPSVGLLNVGEEDQKGFDYLREAAAVLSADSLNLIIMVLLKVQNCGWNG